ncbi:hypothetical protein VPH35_049128 [Triticum aestivum]
MKAGDKARTNPASSSPSHFVSSFFLSEIFLSLFFLSENCSSFLDFSLEVSWNSFSEIRLMRRALLQVILFALFFSLKSFLDIFCRRLDLWCSNLVFFSTVTNLRNL